jgi:hypothetical protein
MLRSTIAIAAALAAAGASAAPGGKLGTLPQGRYICSTPGDATGPAWNVIPGGGFTINTASTYHTATGSGTYLLTGEKVVFTRGPLKGQRFVQTGSATLRWVDEEGNPGRVRCVRSGR